MTRMTVYKLVLAGIGLFVFFYGVQTDQSGLRWAGIALVAVALLLRFLREPPKQ